jgi:hypothetical protein
MLEHVPLNDGGIVPHPPTLSAQSIPSEAGLADGPAVQGSPTSRVSGFLWSAVGERVAFYAATEKLLVPKNSIHGRQ